MFVLMSDVWPALKYENNCASFKENYSLKLVIAFKMAYSCCFSLGGGIKIFKNFSNKVLKHQLLLSSLVSH